MNYKLCKELKKINVEKKEKEKTIAIKKKVTLI